MKFYNDFNIFLFNHSFYLASSVKSFSSFGYLTDSISYILDSENTPD